MKIDLINKMIAKARTKKDGVFSLGGYSYRVKNKKVSHFVEYGQIFALQGNFVISLGEFKSSREATSALKAFKD